MKSTATSQQLPPTRPIDGAASPQISPLRRLLASSRFFVVFAVLGAFVAAVVLMIYGAIVVVQVSWNAFFAHGINVSGAKHLAVDFVELIDVFLLGTVLYIVALGLYDLFVDPELPMPAWLHITNLDDLKAKLTEVVVVLLAVTFLAAVVEGLSGPAILYLGVAIALVIAALALLGLTVRHRHDRE